MQRIIGSTSALLAVLLLARCDSAGPSSNDGGPVDSVVVHRPIPPPQLVKNLVGTWMAKDYRDCLTQHRSAFSCRSMGDDIYVLYVERTAKDSLRWSYITTHEGGPEVMLAYDHQLAGYTGQPGEYSSEEVIHLLSVDPDHMDLRTKRNGPLRRFVRVSGEQELLLGALFPGDLVDEKTGDTVRFHTNGKVTGLAGIDQASVLTDFTEGFHDRDIVFLFTGQYDWDRDAYHYVYSGQELLLYPMLATEEEYVYRMGDPKFRLRTVHE